MKQRKGAVRMRRDREKEERERERKREREKEKDGERQTPSNEIEFLLLDVLDKETPTVSASPFHRLHVIEIARVVQASPMIQNDHVAAIEMKQRSKRDQKLIKTSNFFFFYLERNQSEGKKVMSVTQRLLSFHIPRKTKGSMRA